MKIKVGDVLPTAPSMKEESAGTFAHQITWQDDLRNVKCDWRSSYPQLNLDCQVEGILESFELDVVLTGRIRFSSPGPSSAEGGLSLINWVPPTPERRLSHRPGADVASLDLKRCELEDWTVQLTAYSQLDPETNVPSDLYLLPRTDVRFNVLHYNKKRFILAVHREHPRPILTVAALSTLARVWEKNRGAFISYWMGGRDLLACR